MAKATTADSGDRSPKSGSSGEPSPRTGPPTESGRSDRRRQRAKARTKALFAHDRALGSRLVAGADEAGRGCLAGPLVAAGVLLDLDTVSLSERRTLTGLDDSKRVRAEERARLFGAIEKAAAAVSVVVIEPAELDARGLHRCNLDALSATLVELTSAAENLSGEDESGPGSPGPQRPVCLVDGFRLDGCPVEHRNIAQGDSKSAAIAAASVIAKVTRDRIMQAADTGFPGWGFAENVGYGTPGHLEAIRELGISPLHRLSFECSAYPDRRHRLV